MNLCGVAFWFDCHNRDASIFGGPGVKRAKAAAARIRQEAAGSAWRETGDASWAVKEQPRLPVAYEVICEMRRNVLKSPSLDAVMTYVAVALSFTFGIRPSEFCYDSKVEGEHALMSHGVVFYTEAPLNRSLPPWEVAELNFRDGWWRDGEARVVLVKFF